jgi:6-phosphogluconolactonase
LTELPRSALTVFTNAEELNRAALEYTKSILKSDEEQAESRHIVLAGGSTPRDLYRKLAREEGIEWKNVHIWFGDERTVPRDHEESNYKMVAENLIAEIAIPETQVHRMRGEIDPTCAAAEYEAEIERLVPKRGEGRWPAFDLILLGLGEDGHTASLFPDTQALEENTRIVVENVVPQMDTVRITLTDPVLNAARNVLFLASGAAKALALAAVIGGGPDAPPAALVRPTNGELRWYVDRAAASMLP